MSDREQSVRHHADSTLKVSELVGAVGTWIVTVAVYVGSIAIASLVMGVTNWSSGVSAIVGIGLVLVGPALLALRIGLPAVPSLAAAATLLATYYAVLSLADNSGYDTPRWDYGHLFDGLTLLLFQALAAVVAVVAARMWHRYRGTEFTAAASHLKYRTR